MASMLTAAHTPAVNHPTQVLAGFSATHSVAAEHFTTDAVAHGNDVSARVVQALATATTPLAGWIAQGSGFVPAGGPGTGGHPGGNPSYAFDPNTGTYVYAGNSGSGGALGTGTSLVAAMANWTALNAVAPITSAAGASTPFDTLATMLTNLAGITPAAQSVPDNSPGTSIPTTTGPSLVLPILLLLLAAGAGYYYYAKHRHKAAATA